jgi:hypothetical protein
LTPKNHKQKDDECDYHYLERLREIARIAGLTITFRNKRAGAHRHIKGINVHMNGDVVAYFKDIPLQCGCELLKKD